MAKYGLGGALLLGAGGLSLGLRGTSLRKPTHPLSVLDQKEYSILAALADRIGPANPPYPLASDLNVAERIDTLLKRLHPADVDELKQAISLLENAFFAFLFDGRIQTFTQSPPEVQDDILRQWRSSKLAVRRTVYKALHKLCTATYWSTPEAYEHSGYPSPSNPARGGA
jgi:hypothetical protein